MIYELRQLQSTDLFLMFNILKKIGFNEIKNKITPEKIKELRSWQESGEEGTEADNMDAATILGFNVIIEVTDVILSNLPACEREIYDFLSSVSGMKVKELQEVSMADFAELIIEVIKKEEFKDFFRVVSKSFK